LSSSNSHLSSTNSLIQRAQCYLGLAILIVLDRILKIVLRPINFPSPLIGMALILTSLITAKSYDVHHRPQRFFAPAVDWVAHKWLPCFNAPALVTLPLALAPLPPQSVVTAIIVIAGSVVLTCAFTSRIAIAIRAATCTEYQPPPPPQSHYVYLYGPGDVLFSFLGVIILSFGFKTFDEFIVLLRHRYEVLGTTFLSAGFSMLSTAVLARLAGLPSELARAVVPRGATLALALPIAERLGASSQLTAAAVALTGLIGCNFVQALMTAFGATDPISRGLTAAATAHGLGTAAMVAREPEGLPFAALSYALCGVSASILACIPPFRSILLWLTS
jgi:putative effector of murein hydrolase